MKHGQPVVYLGGFQIVSENVLLFPCLTRDSPTLYPSTSGLCYAYQD